VTAQHIVAIPSWYKSARGSGGGYFRDQALALQQAGWRVAMLAPDLYTPRDLRRGEVAAGRGRAVRVEDDGVPTWRRDALVMVPRLPYRNAAIFAWCGVNLFARYVRANGAPDLVQAHGALNAGVAAWAIRRRRGIPYILTEHSTAFAQGRLRWWERDLVRRVIGDARHCLAVSPQLAALLSRQYPGSRWEYLPNPLGEAFLAADAVPTRQSPADPFVFVSVARLSPEKGHARLIDAFADAFGSDPGTRLRLAGEGPIRDILGRLAEFYVGVEATPGPRPCRPQEGEPDARGPGDALICRFALDLRNGAFETCPSQEGAARAILWRLTIARLRAANPQFLAANGFD